MTPSIELLPHQLAYVSDISTRHIGLCAGFGAGKTYAFCVKAVFLASLNIGYAGVLLEPTNSLVKIILQPKFEDVLRDMRVPFTLKQMPVPIYTLHFQHGDAVIMMMSAENYTRHIGYEVAHIGIDEIDTIKKDIAEVMFQKLQGRMRVGKTKQIYIASTPEGFSWMYDFFVKNAKTNRRLIKARTVDNPMLDPDYIENLMADYPPQLIAAYLEGEFINLTSGTIYDSFDRRANHTDLVFAQLPPATPLHIGMDFNVNKCSAIVHVVDKDRVYAIDEILGGKNTTQMIEIIKRCYPKNPIFIYPDSSGKSQKTNASSTDIVLLQQAFGNQRVKYHSTNPFVRDRIGAMNAMFCNAKGDRRYLVNTNKCVGYTEALEQQVYTKAGEPDKKHDQDHPNDSAGYVIHYMFPIKGKATLRTY